MKRLKIKVISFLVVAILTVSAFNFTFAAAPLTLSSAAQLTDYALKNSVNVMLYNENGKILNEFHPDGHKVDFTYDSTGKKIKEVKTSDGIREVLNENSDGTIDVGVYKNGSFVMSKKENNIQTKLQGLSATKSDVDVAVLKKASLGQLQVSTSFSAMAVAPMSLTAYEDYNIYNPNNGPIINLNSLCPALWSVASGSDKFCRSPTAMTQTDIQNLLNSNNSYLKNQIQVWAKNSSGTVYDTGKRVIPAAVIDKASRDWWINPKVIIATIQKESSLITSQPGDPLYPASPGARVLLYCMGYGATGSGDIYSCTGFDTQVDGGTHLLSNLWYVAYNKGQSAFPYLLKDGTFNSPNGGLNENIIKTIDGHTYQNYIWVKDCGTYALFNYTPWTIDVKSNPVNFSAGNNLFVKMMRQFWPGNSSSNYNGANWN